MLDVVGIGSPFVDYFFEADNNFLKKYNLGSEDDFLFTEKKLSPDDVFNELPLLSKSAGGISTNTLSVLAYLGAKVGYFGVIGKDRDGDFWLKTIGKIDKSKISRGGTTSICACILSSRRKHRLFLSLLNPHDNEFLKHINSQYLNDAKFLHVGPLLFNPHKNIQNLYKLLGKIKKPLISFSPNLPYVNLGLKKISLILAKTYILFLNKNEVRILANRDEKSGSRYLLKYGPTIVVCTLGEKGALITSQNRQFYVPGNKIRNIVDTTGAGDTFAAGFLYGLLKDKTLKEAAQFATSLAAKSLTDFGLNWLKR